MICPFLPLKIFHEINAPMKTTDRLLLTANNQKPKSIIGKPMTGMEYENMLNESRNSKSYTLEDAKRYLKI